MSLAVLQDKGAVQPPQYPWTEYDQSNWFTYSSGPYDASPWFTSFCNVTTGKAAPDGSTDAAEMADINDALSHDCYLIHNLNQPLNNVMTTSFYVRPTGSSNDWARITCASFGTLSILAYYDITNETVGDPANWGTDVISAGIEDAALTYPSAPTGWKRIWITYPTDSADTVTQFRLHIASGDGTVGFNHNGTWKMEVWGALSNEGYLPDPYYDSGTTRQETILRGRTRSTTAWTPANSFDIYTGVRNFDTVQWNKAFSVGTSNVQVNAPEIGFATNVVELRDDSGAVSQRPSMSDTMGTVLPGNAKLCAFLAKAGSKTWCIQQLTSYGTKLVSCYYDLINGEVGATIGADVVDQGMVDAGGGWWWCWFLAAADADTNWVWSIGLADDDGDNLMFCDGTHYAYFTAPCLMDGDVVTTWDPDYYRPYATYEESESQGSSRAYSTNNVIYSYKGAVQPTRLATGPYAGFTDQEYKRSKIMYARNVMRHTPRRRYR